VGKARTKKRDLTAEAAARRIGQLRHVFDEGYMARNIFEQMKRDIEVRIERRNAARVPKR
jgi:hypothetical protein